MKPTTALQFGGGKDSLACLYLLEGQWDKVLVTWLNTGSAFPETIAQMDEIRALVPHFLEVKTDAAADIEANGWPVDVVPTSHTPWGSAFTGNQGVKMRSWIECCSANFWVPLDAAMREHGINRVIRGQRNSEHYKSPVRSGMVVDGIEYIFPLQEWSEAQVFAFLEQKKVPIPAYYEHTKSSLDCWNCTAYLDFKDAQIAYMREHHPEKYAIVHGKLTEIAAATKAALRPLESVL